MGITVTVNTAKLEAFAARLHVVPIAALEKVAQEMKAEMIRKIESPPKTGRIYGTHQASAPGEAPAADTGTLAGSITVDRSEKEVILSAQAPYAAVLEHGGAHIAPRPFFYNTVEELWPKALGEIADAIKGA